VPTEPLELEVLEVAGVSRTVPEPAAPEPTPVTPFATVYSPRAYEFASNLRRVGCPEETVKDIIVAETNRRFRPREEGLRPKPADHVPFGWSPHSSEAKLLERRREAANIAREKEAFLRMALGYEVRADIPLYAMTTSDLRFQETIKEIPQDKRGQAYAAQERYWLLVDQLRSRTKGFWEAEDRQELEALKSEWRETLRSLREGQQ
jgi:hypothetical protein